MLPLDYREFQNSTAAPISEEELILNQLTWLQDLTWEKICDIEKRAKALIDSEWHYSWHWECSYNGSGSLTSKGWETALKDGIDLRDSLQNHVDALNKIIPQIESIVKRDKLRQRLDEIYEKEENEKEILLP